MGPTNIALVKLFQEDRLLRAAQERLHHESRSVRQQQRRINDLQERATLTQDRLRHAQSQQAQLDLDVKAREAKIERLRVQQQSAKNHKEYQTFLSEINTEKIDKNKMEDEWLKVTETVEKLQAELKDLNAQLEGEKQRHQQTLAQLSGRLAELQAAIDRQRPVREEAAAAVPATARDLFEKLCERYEGEAMSAIGRTNPRREEYVCTACNMDLVADVYNKLHSRDEMVPCPNCRRLLYIPDDLPPELAINRKKERATAETASAEGASKVEA